MKIELVLKIDGEEVMNLTEVKDGVNFNVDNQPNEYSRIYDDSCPNWVKDPEYNKLFILQQQAYANNLLKQRGYLFLNEVYDMFGFARTKAGQIVGWLYDDKIEDKINFGIFNCTEQSRYFINGFENSVLLNFNVDGDIWEKID